MKKFGRNDLCHCGSEKKYKKCCLEKDGRIVRLKTKKVTFSRKDFISGPYRQCPKCDKDTFGVFVHTGGSRYDRECTSCWYTQQFLLPVIKKKVIYLDQFMISNMTKALDPEARSHVRVLEEPFWLEVYKKIDILSKLNLVVFPDSSFHTDESLLSDDPSYDSLKYVYEHLSGGCSFYDHNSITRFQVQEHLANYLEGHPSKPLLVEAENVVHGELNQWRGQIRVSANMRPFEGQIESIKKERKSQHEGLKKVFERWQKEKGRDFMEWVREESSAFGEGTVKAHIAFLKKRDTLPQKYAEQYLAGEKLDFTSLDGIFPPPSSEIIDDMTYKIQSYGLSGQAVVDKITEYLKSKYIFDIPSIHTSSMLFGGLARKASDGQKAYPNEGTVTDVNIISSLLPYCDAIFIDNPMAGILNDQPIKKEIEKYGTKIFSLNTKEQFLAYLDEIKASASPEHFAIVADAYGEVEPYTTLLINNKQRGKGDSLLDES